MKIIPAILSEDLGDFLAKLRQAESFTDAVQIDFMDGIFVPSRSLAPAPLSDLRTPLALEIHLMVADAAGYLAEIRTPSLKKVVWHFESQADHPALIREVRGRGLEPGLALNPETTLEEIREIAGEVPSLLFLTVDPGYSGSPFLPEILPKIAKARALYPGKILAADGGISLENLPLLAGLGLDYVCVGSRIFKGGPPAENYRRFIKELGKLEGRGQGKAGSEPRREKAGGGTMRIAIGADHGGWLLKKQIVPLLQELGHEVQDLGTHTEDPVDYPDYSRAVAENLRGKRADRGILICGSGVGACVAANKFPGIRAALCGDTFSARQGVEDDDVNVLCLGARVVGPELAKDIVRVWLSSAFSGAERHRRRLAKIEGIEEEVAAGKIPLIGAGEKAPV